MMNEPKHPDIGPVRPQVIDLDAEEISTEADTLRRTTDEAPDGREAPPPGGAPEAAAGHSGRRAVLWVLAALILGLIGGGWLYRGVLADYFPSAEMTAVKDRLAALETSGSSLAGEIASLQQEAAGAAAAAAGAEQAAQAAEAALAEAKSASAALADLGARADGMDQRIAAAEAALQSATADLAQFRTSLQAAASAPEGTAPPAADTAALAALGQRIEALEKDVASLKSSAAQSAGGETASLTAALSQALSDLKAKVAAGTSYAEEYDRIARMVPAAAGLDTVGARAGEGLPNAEGLTAELRAAIPALPQPAAPVAEDNSYFGTLMQSLQGVVTIRAIGETDWPGVAERAAAFAEAGDLNQAIAVIDGAEGEKPMALTRWRDRAAARLQLEAALADVSEAVLRQIAAIGGAQP